MSVRSDRGADARSEQRDRAAAGARRRVRVGHPFLLGSPRHHSQGSSLYPRIQGHEFAGTVESTGHTPPVRSRSALGWQSGRSPRAAAAMRVAPVDGACATISSSSASTGTAGWRTSSVCRSTRPFGRGDLPATLAALVEPMAVAVHGVAHGAVQGEQVVSARGALIGQAVSLAAPPRGTGAASSPRYRASNSPPFSGRNCSRLAPAAMTLPRSPAFCVDERGGRSGCDRHGPGVPEAIGLTIDLVSSAGRVVVLGISDQQVALPIGLFTSKEFDIRGSSCQRTGGRRGGDPPGVLGKRCPRAVPPYRVSRSRTPPRRWSSTAIIARLPLR